MCSISLLPRGIDTAREVRMSITMQLSDLVHGLWVWEASNGAVPSQPISG